MGIASAISQSARGESQQPAFMGSCLCVRVCVCVCVWVGEWVGVCVFIFFHRGGFFRLKNVQDKLEGTDQRSCVVNIR